MTHAEYQRICNRLARKAILFAKAMGDDEEVINTNTACPKCGRPVGAPCKFPVWASNDDAPKGFVHNERAIAAIEAQTTHWIDVFLDEHLPSIEPEVLLAVTSHADAYEKVARHPAPSFWDAIETSRVRQPNNTEGT